MHTMEIFKPLNAKIWMVKCSDPNVAKLFGSSILPTAFTKQATEEMVLSHLKKINPDREVSVMSIFLWNADQL